MTNDIRLALRLLRRAPMSTAIALASIARRSKPCCSIRCLNADPSRLILLNSEYRESPFYFEAAGHHRIARALPAAAGFIA